MIKGSRKASGACVFVEYFFLKNKENVLVLSQILKILVVPYSVWFIKKL